MAGWTGQDCETVYRTGHVRGAIRVDLERDPPLYDGVLEVAFGDKVVLEAISFEVRAGEIFVILGGSGSGKTTLLRNLVGLMQPRSGRILIGGRDFTAMSGAERMEMRRKMGMCFQGSALLGSLSIADNVALPLREHTKLEESTIDIMTRIKLELVGLGGVEDALPSELSGGMRKRAGIARAMAGLALQLAMPEGPPGIAGNRVLRLEQRQGRRILVAGQAGNLAVFQNDSLIELLEGYIEPRILAGVPRIPHPDRMTGGSMGEKAHFRLGKGGVVVGQCGLDGVVIRVVTLDHHLAGSVPAPGAARRLISQNRIDNGRRNAERWDAVFDRVVDIDVADLKPGVGQGLGVAMPVYQQAGFFIREGLLADPSRLHFPPEKLLNGQAVGRQLVGLRFEGQVDQVPGAVALEGPDGLRNLQGVADAATGRLVHRVEHRLDPDPHLAPHRLHRVGQLGGLVQNLGSGAIALFHDRFSLTVHWDEK